MRMARNKTQDMWSIFVLLAVALALLTGSAAAQVNSMNPSISVPNDKMGPVLERLREQRQQKQLDDAYKAASRKIPDQKSNDPWAEVRPAPAVPAPKKKSQ